jgi:predicted Zn finger-like uncharacterized protein
VPLLICPPSERQHSGVRDSSAAFLAPHPAYTSPFRRTTRMSSEPTLFACPNCGTSYKVVSVEVEPAPFEELEVACLTCGAPFSAMEGRFALKYFRIKTKRPKK